MQDHDAGVTGCKHAMLSLKTVQHVDSNLIKENRRTVEGYIRLHNSSDDAPHFILMPSLITFQLFSYSIFLSVGASVLSR